MMKFFLQVLFIGSVLQMNAQVKPEKKNAYGDPKKYGGYTVTKVEKDETVPGDAGVIEFTFIGANNKPVKAGVTLGTGSDSLVPKLSSIGTYSVELDPGNFAFSFAAPYWYRIKANTIPVRAHARTLVTVKFEAMDFSAR